MPANKNIAGVNKPVEILYIKNIAHGHDDGFYTGS